VSFALAFIAPLAPSEDVALSNRAWPAPLSFQRDGFDETMAKVAPELAIDVPDPHDPRGKPQRVELRFSSIRSFDPAQITAQVPLLRVLNADGDRAYQRTLDAVTQHPAVKSLARAWRGLQFLVKSVAHTEQGDDVTFTALAAAPDETEAAIAKLAAGEDAVGLFVLDHEIGTSTRDLDLLATFARAAENAGAPAIVAARAEVLGYDDMKKLAKTSRRIESADDPRARALMNVAAKDESRWIALALNGGLAVSAAVMIGAMCAKSAARTGWPCEIIGPANSKLENLPVHKNDDGDEIPLETLVPEAVVKGAANAGACVLECAKNGDVAVLNRAPVLHRGAIDASGASPSASATLPEQLFVARIAQAVTQLASALPRDTPAGAAKEVAHVALAEACAGVKRAPEFSIGVDNGTLQVTVRPRGAFGIRIEEFTLAARMG
jgi:predicted component of type VI protein secretion system